MTITWNKYRFSWRLHVVNGLVKNFIVYKNPLGTHVYIMGFTTLFMTPYRSIMYHLFGINNFS